MRKNFGAKPWSYPQPVFIVGTYDENNFPDVMNVAWGGISGRTEIVLCINPAHKTVKNFKTTGAFTVSMAEEKYLEACDYVGITSAKNEVNKFEKAGFHAIKSENVNAPIVEELAMCLECKVKSYDDQTGILTGEIVNVSVDESILTDDKIDPAKLNPITFDPVNFLYWTLGKKVGKAFSDGKKLKS